MKLWEGLGYYRRVRHMQEAARQMMSDYNGIFPDTYDEIIKLKGIGAYTASAISSIAFGREKGVVDGNTLRILSRIYNLQDNIAQDKFGDWNSVEAVMKAAKYSEELREQCLKERKSLIFETVLSVYDKVDFIQRAKEAGFFIRLFFVCTNSPSINASRIADRIMAGGHDVPITKIISRYQKSISNCSIASKFVDRTYVYDNSIDYSEAQLLFRLAEGKLVKQYADLIPDWARPILP